MTFVFWQNMVSIHQVALLKHLAQDNMVLLVAAQAFEQIRNDSGWNMPDMGKVHIITSPSATEVKILLKEHSDACHIFSGISAYPMVYSAFRKACRKKLRIFVYMEPYETDGFKGCLRLIYYRLLALRYGHCISAILATGETGVKAYEKAGFNSNRIYEWGYFTEAPARQMPLTHKNGKRKLLFVGRLDHNKQIMSLIETFIRTCKDVAELSIVGTGPLKEQVEQSAEQHSSVKYLGVLPNQQLKELMQEHDVLVLPSLYDGWGCVVNEALQAGLQILCSEACGAATLIREPFLGSVFSWQVTLDFENKLYQIAHNSPLTPEERANIITWADKYISAQAAGAYLNHIIRHAIGSENIIPLAPWHKSL